MRLIRIALLLLVCSFVGYAQTTSTLSPGQIDALKKIKLDTEKRSAPYAAKLAITVKRIYGNMLAEHEDQRLRKRLSAEIHRYTGKLLDIRGQAYRDAIRVLTPEQRLAVRKALAQPAASQDMGEVIEKTFGLAAK